MIQYKNSAHHSSVNALDLCQQNQMYHNILIFQVGTVGPEMSSMTTELWFRVTILGAVEILFILGICCAIGYYGFLHPDKSNIWSSTSQPSWRR